LLQEFWLFFLTTFIVGFAAFIERRDTIEGNDGKRWIYGHINSSVRVGESVNVGSQIGSIFDQRGATHFHIEVQTPTFDPRIIGGIPYASMGKLNFVLEKTISPLHAFWQFQNQ
jgi:hypothetical protein